MGVAETILQQLGGASRIKAMIGVKNFMKGKDTKGEYLSIQFSAKARNGVNYIKITLNGLDLYDIELGQIRGLNYKIKYSVDNVYADQLKSILEDNLDLRLSL